MPFFYSAFSDAPRDYSDTQVSHQIEVSSDKSSPRALRSQQPALIESVSFNKPVFSSPWRND